MPKYRKKAVIVDAVQLRWDTWSEMCEHAGVGKLDEGKPEGSQDGEKIQLLIPTLEGLMTASENDYVIRGVKGELYPCKPDIFEETYELVDIVEGEPVPDSMPTTQHFLKHPHGEVGFEVVGNKIVERWNVTESLGESQALSDKAKCVNPKVAAELCDLLNDGRKVEKLLNFIASCASHEEIGEHVCEAAIRIIEKQAHMLQNIGAILEGKA